MPYSKVDNKLEFNENKWVVSLLNTESGTDGKLGGHAKIVVEGLKPIVNDNVVIRHELYVAEFHIIPEGLENNQNSSSYLPWFMTNVKGTLLVLHTERDEYIPGKKEQYERSHSKSWYASPTAANNMILNIKRDAAEIQRIKNLKNQKEAVEIVNTIFVDKERDEMLQVVLSQANTADGLNQMVRTMLEKKYPYQYAGNWSYFSYNNGHNCISWVEDKLAIAGVGNGVLKADSSKASPEYHVTKCILQ